MKLHIVTVGKPKHLFAVEGWNEYLKRLQHYHNVQTTHIPDKHNDSEHLLTATEGSYRIGLVIEGRQLSSPELAQLLEQRALDGKALSFIIGGPDGLPPAVQETHDYRWSFGKLT